MLKNPFKALRKREWILWGISLLLVLLSNLLCGQMDAVNLAATSLGVTALIFIARGDVWGQILTVVFSILYGIVSFRFRYWGEMITYLGMTLPIAVMSIITWLKNPYGKDVNEVRIARLGKGGTLMMWALTLAVTAVFYFILRAFDTPNLLPSTFSVTTSFLACYLLMMRNSHYALAYAANDVVLIILWVLATLSDLSYLPMVVNFSMFLINDLYGFISWKKREKKQGLKAA
ncbi:MAG: nicotinamide mononucleotide transporter [Clostridiales bacterium]|nr:nicotinamide mononucleotide transporter [Clostridiales bacterium]